MEIVNFFVSNYIWFLGAIIIILLAIIGYVADKTNFGQGKNMDDQIDIESLNSMGIDQLYSRNIEQQEKEDQVKKEQQIPNTLQSENNNLNLQEPDLNNLFDQNNNLENNVTNEENNNILNLSNDLSISEPVNLSEVKQETKNINVDLSSVLASTQVINDKIDKMKNNVGINLEVETAVDYNDNDFDEEFNLLLPEKEVIENDLLSDIEDIELDKTLKYDFSDISNFSNIELPSIKDVNKKNHDLWKF